MLKKSDILYKCRVDEYEGRIELEEWHVTNVDKRGIFLTEKVDKITWGKRSRSHGDYGWLSPIDKLYRDKLNPDEDYKKKNYHKSKAAAHRSVLPELKRKANKLNAMVRRLEKKVKV